MCPGHTAPRVSTVLQKGRPSCVPLWLIYPQHAALLCVFVFPQGHWEQVDVELRWPGPRVPPTPLGSLGRAWRLFALSGAVGTAHSHFTPRPCQVSTPTSAVPLSLLMELHDHVKATAPPGGTSRVGIPRKPRLQTSLWFFGRGHTWERPVGLRSHLQAP